MSPYHQQTRDACGSEARTGRTRAPAVHRTQVIGPKVSEGPRVSGASSGMIRVRLAARGAVPPGADIP